MAVIEIQNRSIGIHEPCFIIAEAGVNHNGSMDLAVELVDKAVWAGADAVKFQTFKPESVVTAAASKADYQKRNTGDDESQLDMIRRLQFTYDEFQKIKKYCDTRRIIFLSTPFDDESVDFLDSLEVPAFKIASGEINNYPLLKHVSNKKKPIILSTGMSYLGEVEKAVNTIYLSGNRRVVLLHCVSNYPAAPEDVNLRAMSAMAAAFGVPVGYSDHTLGIEVSLAAVALGACVIEKHFTLGRTMPGPDHRASLEPGELKDLVGSIRIIESAMGHGRKEPSPSEEDISRAARRSLVAACDIKAGIPLLKEHIAIKRPGTGLPPSMIRYLLGRKSRHMISADTFLTLDLFE
jgi:N,N'-diacetyllegionaminate synthase